MCKNFHTDGNTKLAQIQVTKASHGSRKIDMIPWRMHYRASIFGVRGSEVIAGDCDDMELLKMIWYTMQNLLGKQQDPEDFMGSIVIAPTPDDGEKKSGL